MENPSFYHFIKNISTGIFKNKKQALGQLETLTVIESKFLPADNISHFAEKVKAGGYQNWKLLIQNDGGHTSLDEARWLASHLRKELYRVDMSRVVSKYIGETEKNLSIIFNRAEEKNWILLFDESDALFGKRTKVQDSNDRYANMEVSYLLQRIKSHNGPMIIFCKTAECKEHTALVNFHFLE